jgi:hypothetical protein
MGEEAKAQRAEALPNTWGEIQHLRERKHKRSPISHFPALLPSCKLDDPAMTYLPFLVV